MSPAASSYPPDALNLGVEDHHYDQTLSLVGLTGLGTLGTFGEMHPFRIRE